MLFCRARQNISLSVLTWHHSDVEVVALQGVRPRRRGGLLPLYPRVRDRLEPPDTTFSASLYRRSLLALALASSSAAAAGLRSACLDVTATCAAPARQQSFSALRLCTHQLPRLPPACAAACCPASVHGRRWASHPWTHSQDVEAVAMARRLEADENKRQDELQRRMAATLLAPSLDTLIDRSKVRPWHRDRRSQHRKRHVCCAAIVESRGSGASVA